MHWLQRIRPKRRVFIMDTFRKNKGIVVQFISSTCPLADNIIGAIRLPFNEIYHFPRYLEANGNLLKKYAIMHLDAHLSLCRCIDMGEELVVEDLYCTYTIQSVTVKMLQNLTQQADTKGTARQCAQKCPIFYFLATTNLPA